MSESENAEDVFNLKEICEYDTRNLVGCDNDINCCTFPKGYVYRQALHYCVTCKEITGKEAGICYPCAVQCHSGHILEDLYTKRNFRCDCGNSNFPSDLLCKLWEEKDDVNMKNNYNHNFSGLYCDCNSTYDETKDTEEMIQCVICEDWYHLQHLSESPGEIESLDMERFEEFICKLCMKTRDYLNIYNRANINNVLRNNADESQCNLIATSSVLAGLPTALPSYTCGSFWNSDWREKLCRCCDCVARMSLDGCSFLLDSKDSIASYYADDRVAEELLGELCNLPYSQAIRLAEGIASLKQHLTEFFSSLDPEKVVTADDVHSFFDKIKRRRLERFD